MIAHVRPLRHLFSFRLSALAVLATLALQSLRAITLAPTIGTPPQTQTIPGLGSATLTVSATGTGTLTYQWKFNTDPISGATGASFTLPYALKKDAGAYTVTVTDSNGQTTSNPANITVGPYVLNSTASFSVGAGGRARFFVTADGSGTLSYQWRKNGHSIDGATASTYEITATTVADAGTYDVVVSHNLSLEKATSPAATLTVLPNPSTYTATTQIADSQGVTAFVSVTGTGSKKLIFAAYGPALSDGAAIADPQIVVENAAGTSVATNNDWGSIVDGNFSADYTLSGLRTLTSGSKDAVVYTTLAAGSYRVRITGVSGGTGKVGIAIADLDSNPTSRIAYLGVLAPVSPASPLTGGFKVVSSSTRKLLVRAVGPGLGTTGLADPILTLFDTDGTTVAATNDNWGGGTPLKTVFAQAGMFALGDASKDAAVSDTLFIGKGSYTAQVTSTAGSGAVLWEFADLEGTTPSAIAPIVLLAPSSQNVASGGNATLSVLAIGGGTLSYQWRNGTENILNATNSTYTATASGSYDVVVSSSTNPATATSTAAAIAYAPSIGTNPQSQTIAGLGSATLTVSATGSGPLSYQWKFNNDPINGATGTSYTLPFALKKDAGAYTVTVTNAAGDTTSSAANITVGPYVLNTTTSFSVGLGGRARFFVTADGSGTLSYQWRKDGQPIDGATASTYEISAVTVPDAGSYDVVVSHNLSVEKATSTAATLTVVANPAVYIATTQVADDKGVTAFLALEGTGSKKVILAAYGPALSDGAAIADPQIVVENAAGTSVATNNDWGSIVDGNFSADYARTGLRPLTSGSKDAVVYTTLSAGSYRIRITGVGSATGKVGLAIADLDSNPTARIAYLGVRGPVSPTTPLTGGFTVLSSANQKLLVRAVGSVLGSSGLADPVLSLYDTDGTTVAASNDNWGGGNTLKSAFTQAGTFTLGDASKDAAISDSLLIGKGSYTAQITSVSGSGDVLWEIADLKGNTATSIAPLVVIGPTSQTVTGGNLTLSASAVGGGTLSYQWRKGTENIPGATNSTLTLTGVTPTNSGLYDVVVSTSLSAATATSDAANLQVAPAVSEAAGPLASSYKANGVLTFELTFNGSVTVTGSPRLALTLGASTVYATYNSSASTATKLVFNYTIQSGDADADGIAVATTIDLNGGTIKDAATNNAGLTFTAPTLTAVLVDTSAPTLSSVTLASSNTATTRAKTGDTVTLVFAASEKISSPTVFIAGQSVSATNSSGNTWSASYTLTGSDTEGSVGFSIAFADIAANAGTTVTATTDSSAVTFDRTAPTLGTVALASNNAQTARAKVGDTITLAIAASEAIGTPTVNIGGRSATVTSNGAITPAGSGYTATIIASDSDPEGSLAIAIAFTDLAGNAGTTVTATTDSSAVALDRTAPTLTTVTLASNNATPSVAKAGDIVTLTLTASETIGTPTVTLAGHSVTATHSSGNTWSATHTLTGSDTEGLIAFSVGFADLAGNTGTAVTATTDSSTVTFDRTAPTITSAASATGTYKSAFSHTVTATGGAVLFGATNLPAGLSIDPATGAITGSPTVNGSTIAAVSATDLAGNTSISNLTIDLAKATLTVTGITASNRVYDAGFTASLTTTAAALVGVVNGDTVVLDTSAAVGTFLSKEIGTGKTVQISGLTISGASATNYALTQPTTTANITAKELTVTGITAANKVYDSTRQATLATASASLVGIAGSDAVQLVTAAANGVFADANAGTGKTVQVSGLALTGGDAGNYTLTQPTATASITPAPVTFSFANLNHVYDGTSKSASVSASPAVPFSVTYSVGVNGAGPVNAGTYTVMANVTDPNYGGSGVASLVIAKATQTITISATGGVVGASVPVSATSSAGLPVSLSVASGGATLAGGSLNFTAAGSVVLVATQSGNENTAPATAELTLTVTGKRDQTISFGELPDLVSNAPAFTLTASASSGLAPSFTVAGPAILNGNVLSLTGAAGLVTVTASQAGDATFNAAPSVSRSFNITLAGPSVFMGPIAVNGIPSGTAGVVVPPGSPTGTLVFSVPGSLSFTTSFQLPQGSETVTFTITVNFTGTGLASTPGTPPRAAEVRTFTVRMTAAGSVLNARFDEIPVSFSAPLQGSGPTSAVAGLYQSSNINSSGGSTSTVVGTNGQVVTVATTATGTVSGTTTLAANGTFSLSDSTATITGAIDAATTTVSGTISIPGQAPVNFAGVSATTMRTDRMINLSSRVRVAPAGDRTLITGFVISGSTEKRVLLRAIGPALAGFGLSDALANPRLELYNSAGQLLQQNDDWSGTETAAAAAQVGAFALPAGSRDAAMLVTLPPGAYTMQVRTSSESGVALAEIYDASANPQGEYQRLINISSRGTVESGDGVLVGGFVVTGNAPKKMLIRGVGPALAGFGVTGVLADPRLAIYSGATVIARNDDWNAPVSVTPNQVTADGAQLAAAASGAGAFALSAGSRDAALIVTLAPGAYTAQVSTAEGGGTGVALVEIYEIP